MAVDDHRPRNRRRLGRAIGALSVVALVLLLVFEWRLPFEMWNIPRLHSKDAGERARAIEALVELGSTRGAAALYERWLHGIDGLDPLLDHIGDARRHDLYEDLLRFGELAVPALIGGLRSPRSSVRMWSAHLLAQLDEKGADAAGALLEAVEDPEPKVGLLAGHALGKVARLESAALQRCAAFVADAGRDDTGRESGLLALSIALGELRELEEPAAERRSGSAPPETWDELSAHDPWEIPERIRTACELFLKALETASRDADVRLRTAALEQLQLLEVPRLMADDPRLVSTVRDAIHRGLADRVDEVRLASLPLLYSALPLPREALIQAWEILPRAPLRAQSSALEGLARTPPPWPSEAQVALAACLRNEELKTSELEACFLAEDDGVLALLERALEDDSDLACRRALTFLGRRKTLEAEASRVWARVLGALARGHLELDDAAMGTVRRMARSGNVEARGLLDLLRADAAAVRRRAAVVLGVGGWEPDIVGPPLRAALDDADAGVQAAALQSWVVASKLDDASLARELSRRLSSSPHAAVRWAALRILAEPGAMTSEALPAIRQAASDDAEPQVRAAAAELAARLDGESGTR